MLTLTFDCQRVHWPVKNKRRWKAKISKGEGKAAVGSEVFRFHPGDLTLACK